MRNTRKSHDLRHKMYIKGNICRKNDQNSDNKVLAAALILCSRKRWELNVRLDILIDGDLSLHPRFLYNHGCTKIQHDILRF